MAVQTRIAEISPEYATKLLKKNEGNRPISRTRIAQYKKDMEDGNWKLNGEPIQISSKGRLMNGQHRLMAIIESDKTVDILIVTGLDDDAQLTMDANRTRSLKDAFDAMGEPYATALQGVVHTLWRYGKDGKFLRGNAKPSVPVALQILDDHPDLRVGAKFAQTNTSKWVRLSLIGTLYYLFSNVEKANEEKVANFFKRMRDGADLTSGDPILLLRNKLTNYYMEEGRRYADEESAALIIKAWNQHMTGAKMGSLKWDPADGFPQIANLQIRI